MPALRFCMKKWAIASNDFVLPALVSLLLHLIWIGGDVALIVYTYVLNCTPSPKAVFITYLFSQLLVHILVTISETLIFLESAKGPILNERTLKGIGHSKDPRKFIPVFVGIRCVLFVIEVLEWCVGMSLISVDRWISGSRECPDEVVDRIHNGVKAFNFCYGISLLLMFILFVAFMDPLGCCGTTSFYWEHKKRRIASSPITNHIHVVSRSLSVRYSTTRLGRFQPGQKFWTRVLNRVLCCVWAKKNDNYASLESQIALALAILFENQTDLVISDVWAAFVLVQEHQQDRILSSRKEIHCCCVDNVFVQMMRSHTQNVMSGKQFVGGKSEYNYISPRKLDLNRQQVILNLEESLHYFPYALGMYGWKIYGGIHKPCTGFCNLLCAMRYPCFRSVDETGHIECDNLHMDTAALALTAEIVDTSNILYASWEVCLHQVPFAVIYDPHLKSVVIAIRGTLSLKDILTDFNTKMVTLHAEDDSRLPQAYLGLENMVHMGMYSASKEIMSKLTSNNSYKRNLIEYAFETFPDAVNPGTGEKQLVIVGHSLGGGIASVLALLLKPLYPGLKCFAYSPPGCVFSFSLATYSKDFVSTFVVGNDVISRLNWRSLLFLKRSLETRLKECNTPKHLVLFPKCLHCGIATHNSNDKTTSEDIQRPRSKLGLAMNRVHPETPCVVHQPSIAKSDSVEPHSPDDQLLEELFASGFNNTYDDLQEIHINRLPPDGCESTSTVPPPLTECIIDIEACSPSKEIASKGERESDNHDMPQKEHKVSFSEDTHDQSEDDIESNFSQDSHRMGTNINNALFLSHMGSIWLGKTTVNKAVRQMTEVSRLPAFIPGRVYLIEENTYTDYLCKYIPMQKKFVVVHEVANEDMCFIDIGKNSFKNHLPTRMLQMLTKACKQKN